MVTNKARPVFNSGKMRPLFLFLWIFKHIKVDQNTHSKAE